MKMFVLACFGCLTGVALARATRGRRPPRAAFAAFLPGVVLASWTGAGSFRPRGRVLAAVSDRIVRALSAAEFLDPLGVVPACGRFLYDLGYMPFFLLETLSVLTGGRVEFMIYHMGAGRVHPDAMVYFWTSTSVAYIACLFWYQLTEM